MTDTAEERDGCSGVSKVVVAFDIGATASEESGRRCNINKCTIRTKTEVGSSPTLLDSCQHVNKQTEVHTIALH